MSYMCINCLHFRITQATYLDMRTAFDDLDFGNVFWECHFRWNQSIIIAHLLIFE